VEDGDFNVTHFPSERLGEARFCPALMEFFDFIFDKGLMDLPLVGGSLRGQIIRIPLLGQ
jgi:hypothetical protein